MVDVDVSPRTPISSRQYRPAGAHFRGTAFAGVPSLLRPEYSLDDQHHPGEQRMEEQHGTGTAGLTSTAVRGTCDECGQTAVLTARVDPESPLSGTMRLCPSCAQGPEPFWH